MKFLVLVLTACCCFVLNGFSQNNYGVKGMVIDTATGARIDKATIVVLNAKDSILQKFTYSDKGLFDVNNLYAGKFIIMITYPDYADFVEHFTIDAAKPGYNFGTIKMILKSRLLDEVIIKARVAAIKIKGDTTEFNAAAYATQKNAKVEDLLKQLQGMKINQSGVLIFQGEPVSKILVDGEEFFSEDPSLVTKNLRADMVNKVQVYDQKSDQAKLTGIEDGVKVKTINIVLMEDKKKGVFGKAEGGYGTDDYYVTQAMVNKFSPKQKISAYGNLGNTGKVGLSSADNTRYGSGYSTGNYEGIGTPFARDAGAHYDSKWNKDKESINVDYKIGALNNEGTSSTITQNNLPGNFNKRNQERNFEGYNFNQSMNGSFSSKLDSTSDLTARFSGYEGRNTSGSNSVATTLRGNGVLQNFNTIGSNSSGENKNVDASVNYAKRFKKKGRSISLNGRTSFSDGNSDSYLLSETAYYNTEGERDSINHIDQYKPGRSNSSRSSAGLNYSDILSKRVSVTAGYNFGLNKSRNDQLSFNKSSNNQYNLLDSAFSSEFELLTLSHTYSLGFTYSTAKTYASLGSSMSSEASEQTDGFLSAQPFKRKFVNWQPYASYRYQLTKAASLSFSYNGYTYQPSSYDLQSIRQNTDPLNIRLGNPELRPSFNHRISYNYRVYQPTKDQGINFRGWYGTTLNAMISNRTTDSTGVNVFQSSNLKSKTPISWNAYTEVYGHATKLDFILSINFTFSGNTGYNYINDQLNKTQTMRYAPQIDIWKNKGNYSYNFSIGPNYSANSSSLQRQIDNNTLGYFVSFGGFTKLPGKFFIGGDLNYSYSAKNEVFDSPFELALLKAHFGRSFLKDEGLKISIIGNDLLDQNTGYSRTSYSGSFNENRNTTIRRYFMFSLTWDYSKFGKSLQKQQP